MKKKITAMLLAICCISSTWTVYADDFSSGSSEVEIEITEDELVAMSGGVVHQGAAALLKPF